MDIMQHVAIFAIAVLGVTEIYIYHEILQIEANTRMINRQMEMLADDLQNITNNIYSVYWLVKGNNQNEKNTD